MNTMRLSAAIVLFPILYQFFRAAESMRIDVTDDTGVFSCKKYGELASRNLLTLSTLKILESGWRAHPTE